VVVVAAVVVAVVLLTGGDGGGADDPEAVATRFVEGVVDGDCDAILDTLLLPDVEAAALEEECEQFVLGGFHESGEDVPVEVLSLEVEQDGDDRATAVAEFRTRGGEERTTDPIPMVRRDGRWLIDGMAFD